MHPLAEGCAVDKKYTDIIYVPEDARSISISNASPGRAAKAGLHQIAHRQDLCPASGYKVHMEKPGPTALAAGGRGCGGNVLSQALLPFRGGKSEIPAISDAILTDRSSWPIETRLDRVAELIHRDYSGRSKSKQGGQAFHSGAGAFVGPP